MSLEIKLKALELSMNNRLDEISEDMIAVNGVQELLTTYFAERDTKPELVSGFKSYSLLYDYLELELEERDELEDFARENPGYLEEGKKEIRKSPTKNDKITDLIKKQRYLNQVLKLFDFYLEHREDFQVFNSNYLQENKALKNRFGNLGRNLYLNTLRNFKDEGGIDYLVQLVSEQRPEILEYWKYSPKNR